MSNSEDRNINLYIYYFILGWTNRIINYPIRQDLKKYDINMSNMSALFALFLAPWIFKGFYGLISDRFPILGYKRKPYIYITNFFCIIMSLCLSYKDLPKKNYIIFLFLLQVFSAWADVIYDSLKIEDTSKETNKKKGNLDTKMWIFRSLGLAVGAFLGPICYRYNEDIVFYIIAVLYSFQLLNTINLYDKRVNIVEKGLEKKEDTLNCLKQISLIKSSIMNPLLAKITLFNLITGLIPSAGIPVFFFLLDEVGFTEYQMALLSGFGEVGRTLGMIFFYKYLKFYTVRNIFLSIGFVTTLMGYIPLILTTKTENEYCEWNYQEQNGTYNNNNTFLFTNYTSPPTADNCYLYKAWGFPPLPFSLSDDIIGEILEEMKNRPVAIISAIVCHQTVEASTYAFIGSFYNGIVGLRSIIDSSLIKEFQIDHNKYNNLSNYIILCSTLDLLSMFFVFLLPNFTIEQISINYNENNPKIELQGRGVGEGEEFWEDIDLNKEEEGEGEEIKLETELTDLKELTIK